MTLRRKLTGMEPYYNQSFTRCLIAIRVDGPKPPKISPNK
jgi:hypothetical protein